MENKMISTNILPKLTSDHKPILLQLVDEEYLGSISFRFSPLWIDREGFLVTIFNAWSIPISGSPNFVWEEKLKNTKCPLKDWIKQYSLSPFNVRKQVVDNLVAIQLEMED